MLICLSGQLEDPRTRCDIFKEQSDKDVSVVYGKLPFPALPPFSLSAVNFGIYSYLQGH